jgi:hypothetical protein
MHCATDRWHGGTLLELIMVINWWI